MLVLSRKKSEIIDIGGGIEIMIVDIDAERGQVRLGISAPPDVTIHRREITERIASNGGTHAEDIEHHADRVSRSPGH